MLQIKRISFIASISIVAEKAGDMTRGIKLRDIAINILLQTKIYNENGQ
jgi:hypothetical protein